MQHGVKNFEVTAPRSRFYQGGFGRLFPDLEPWRPDLPSPTAEALENHMLAIAQNLMTEDPANGGKSGSDSTLPAGYTFFGQFIDHDITLDLTPLSDAQIDPNRLHNARTPRLDLDCVYGLGPGAQPYLYENNGHGITGRMRVGQVPGSTHADLARVSTTEGQQQTALIGDARNDENALVTQVQLAFIQAHNALVDVQPAALSGEQKFEAARKTLRWLYQWIVANDFLPRVCRSDIAAHALFKDPRGAKVDMDADAIAPSGGFVWKLGYKDIYDWHNTPFMPVEFSVAAYRFGHTLVRGAYQVNAHSTLSTFSQAGENLRGFRALAPERVVDWRHFLSLGGGVPQFSRKFDTLLAPALSALPEDPVDPGNPAHLLNVLAARNLVRGVRLELPAGTAVAKALGLEPLPLGEDEPDALWYYILKESAEKEGGAHLGAVGSIIVASTMAGLLLGDPLSYFNIEPCWEPRLDDTLSTIGNLAEADGSWTLASIIRLAGHAATPAAMAE